MKASLLNRYRGVAFSLFIALLIGVFLSGYYYYFIPRNRQAVHKNGFLILSNIEKNIGEKAKSHENLFSNLSKYVKNLNSPNPVENFREVFKKFDIKASVGRGNIKKVLNETEPISEAKADTDVKNYEVAGAAGKSIIYAPAYLHNDSNAAYFAESSASFLEPILATQKSEMFDSYMIVKINDDHFQLLFKDFDIGLRSDAALDSLLGDEKHTLLANIRDIEMADFKYKLFYYPFDLGKSHLMLCGFQKTSEYNDRLQTVPFYFIYTLTICIILVLVLLPIIKFYMMDSNERVGLNDLFMFVLSIFVAASLLTLIIIHFLLWKGEEERVKNNLAKVSRQIERSFLNEITACYNQLSIIDSLAEQAAPVSPETNDTLKLNWGNKLLDKVYSRKDTAGSYYNFDRVSWVNDSGSQIVKLETFSKAVYTNVSEREYFKAFKRNEPLLLPDYSGRQFYWEPIYSWTNADFTITISKRSRVKKAFIAAIATKMYSVLNTVVPAGYGFCIIDENGNVQLHSDGNRNLRENFFKKVQESKELIGTVKSRQQKSINDVNFYGKQNMLNVKPLSGMPFYLVTFYDKGYIVPINMRILIFACLFCIMWFVIAVTMCWLVIPKYFLRFPVLFSPIDCLRLIVPQKKYELFYFHCIVFFLIYILVSLVFLLLAIARGNSNHTVFTLVSMAPINLSIGIALIHFRIHDEITVGNTVLSGNRMRNLIALFHVFVTIACYFTLRAINLELEYNFLVFQFIFHLILISYLALFKKWEKLETNPVSSYLPYYSWVVTLLILCLSVLPASIYTWYAHNQEITQSLKKQQLYLVDNIQKRNDYYLEMFRKNSIARMPDAYVDSLLYRRGIYTIYNDHIEIEPDSAMVIVKDLNERFYLMIADKVGNPYYDPKSLPVLGNTAADLSWFWRREDTVLKFWYRLPGFNYHKETTGVTSQRLLVISHYPPRFIFLGSIISACILAVIVLLLVLALYFWVRVNTGRIFLKKYIQTEKQDQPIAPKKTKSLIAEYYTFGKTRPSFSIEPVTTNDNGDLMKVGSIAQLNHKEKDVFDQLRENGDLYKYIWSRCSEKEKYLLVNFARVGLINYKNTLEIYDLFRKGLLVVDEERMINLFSLGFRAFLLEKVDAADILVIQQRFQKTSTWRAFRLPLLLTFMAIAAFVFFTQEAVFQKLIALGAGISTLASLIPKLLSSDKGGEKTG